MTTLGPLALDEQLWRRGPKTLRPFCARAQVKPRTCSLRLQRALTDFGADNAFATAAKKLKEHYGIEVPPERVRTTTLQHAHALAARAPQAVRTLRPGGPAWIVAGGDGTMVPVVDTSAAPPGSDRRKHRRLCYREARLVTARELGSASARYAATLHEVDDAGLRWAQCVQEAGWGMATRIHAIGDGAPWLALQAARQFGAQGRYTVDLYHVCEYLAAAAPDPQASRPFVDPLRERLRAGDVPGVLAVLRPRTESVETPDEKAPVRAAVRYLENRPNQFDYAFALAHDLPVGSGEIESAHRHVLQARIKKAGAWWQVLNLHAFCQLRTLRSNGQWGDYWLRN